MTNWLPGAERVPTAAYGYPDLAPGAMQAIACMSHIMQGYQSTMIRWALERPFTTYKSAHFTIGRDGRVVQHIGIRDAAWCAGGVRSPTWALLPPGLNPNRCVVALEHEGFSTVPNEYPYDYLYSANQPWPEPMVEASIAVQAWVHGELGLTPSVDTIIGHRETDSVTRADDPGSAWPRGRIIAALAGEAPVELPPRLSPNAAATWVDFGNALVGQNGRSLIPIRYDGGMALYEYRIPRGG